MRMSCLIIFKMNPLDLMEYPRDYVSIVKQIDRGTVAPPKWSTNEIQDMLQQDLSDLMNTIDKINEDYYFYPNSTIHTQITDTQRHKATVYLLELINPLVKREHLFSEKNKYDLYTMLKNLTLTESYELLSKYIINLILENNLVTDKYMALEEVLSELENNTNENYILTYKKLLEYVVKNNYEPYYKINFYALILLRLDRDKNNTITQEGEIKIYKELMEPDNHLKITTEVDNEDYTIIHYLLYFSRVKLLEYLLEKYGKPVITKNEVDTYLKESSYRRPLELLKFINYKLEYSDIIQKHANELYEIKLWFTDTESLEWLHSNFKINFMYNKEESYVSIYNRDALKPTDHQPEVLSTRLDTIEIVQWLMSKEETRMREFVEKYRDLYIKRALISTSPEVRSYLLEDVMSVKPEEIYTSAIISYIKREVKESYKTISYITTNYNINTVLRGMRKQAIFLIQQFCNEQQLNEIMEGVDNAQEILNELKRGKDKHNNQLQQPKIKSIKITTI